MKSNFFTIIVLPWSPLLWKALKVLELGGNTEMKSTAES